MRGAIAAGHPLTAEAGARVLAGGGNAVDAAVGAALVSWVAESPLTGPGAGGFMLVHRARDRSTRVFDFFVSVPGLGLPDAVHPQMDEIVVDFSGGSTQVFQIGAGSVAVPGAAVGLETAHRAFGRLSWRELFGPAIEMARRGIELNRAQAYLHSILDLILRHTPESRAVYERDSGPLRVGDVLVQEELAGTLELLRDRGADDLYRGELAQLIVRHVRERGGGLTERDLTEYAVVRRRPVTTSFRGDEFLSNPPPSAGGILIAYGLRLLRDAGPPGSAEAIDALARVMREQATARVAGGFDGSLRRGGLARRLEERAAVVTRGTTHISVVDADGNAVSLTASTGSGSGVVIPRTGIHLNNMVGEFELAKQLRPGVRLSSGMSPSLVLREGRPRLVAGSAGSLRLRGAVMQVVVNVVGHRLGVREAIERPRVHLEGEDLHCEGGHDPAELDRLETMGWNVLRWRRQNLYFGGAAAVEVGEDGALAAAGDPRRGGAGTVVDA
jgi:gamma-glutamyltranspeptidase / glutathione hydrolase